MTYLSSLRGAAWAGPTLIALMTIGAIAGIALHLPTVMLIMLIGALVLALTISVPTARRERTATVAATPRVTTIAPESLAQRTVVIASGEVRQALVIPVEQVEGYQLVLTVDGHVLLNERNEVVKLPLK